MKKVTYLKFNCESKCRHGENLRSSIITVLCVDKFESQHEIKVLFSFFF